MNRGDLSHVGRGTHESSTKTHEKATSHEHGNTGRKGTKYASEGDESIAEEVETTTADPGNIGNTEEKSGRNLTNVHEGVANNIY